ncbi:zinc finger protein 19-like [Penaeus monodon]|uniref:zinc finger protein 19-like n=1 Tax=Penaeus monodon TaxID=6687 RepID=UPI0018A7B2AC|nr:zinc finger protein 19-like [Penaeus monodon]
MRKGPMMLMFLMKKCSLPHQLPLMSVTLKRLLVQMSVKISKKGNYSIPVETNTVHDASMSNSSVETQKDHTLPSQTNNAALAKKGESNSHAVCATIACELCTSTFPSLAYLEQHMAVHVGEKNFTCHVCGMSFNGRIDLNSHMRLHHARE